MSSIGTQRIFLSAVSREFRRCREMLRSDLMGPDLPCQVTEQANFAVGGESLLAKLDRYVSESTAVVHLIGMATGALSQAEEAAGYLQANPDFLRNYPSIRAAVGDGRAVSYTQWEAYLALHYGIRLYLYLPAESFSERPPGFTVEPEEETSQARHCELLLGLGLDRGEFQSSERLSSLVLRSLSRILLGSGLPAAAENARDLEAFALDREKEDASESEERQTLVPLHLELELPPYLVVGQSISPVFCIREPGRTVFEEVEIEFQIGSVKTTARREHLDRGISLRLLPASDMVLQQEGSSQVHLLMTCKRSSLTERFAWKDTVRVIPSEKLAAVHAGGSNRNQRYAGRIRLELVDEVLSPRIGDLNLALQPIPAGGCRFEMGSRKSDRGHCPDEQQHPVRFSRSWWMSRHPISQRQFQSVMEQNPAAFNSQSDEMPVESVTWDEAVLFCELFTQMERSIKKLPLGFQYRLPTEAEWEFSCGGDEQAVARASVPSGKNRPYVFPISTFPLDASRGANRYGLCDMTGNVFQWCLDGYGPYPADIQMDPCLGEGFSTRVIRGGSWHDPSNFCRPTARAECPPQTRSSRIGFRVVLARV